MGFLNTKFKTYLLIHLVTVPGYLYFLYQSLLGMVSREPSIPTQSPLIACLMSVFAIAAHLFYSVKFNRLDTIKSHKTKQSAMNLALSEFEQGVFYAASIAVEVHNEPTIAVTIIQNRY